MIRLKAKFKRLRAVCARLGVLYRLYRDGTGLQRSGRSVDRYSIRALCSVARRLFYPDRIGPSQGTGHKKIAPVLITGAFIIGRSKFFIYISDFIVKC